MKVFVAGASGALGAQLVPKLVAAGHQVVAMTKTESKQDGLRKLGARPVVADALDSDAGAGATSRSDSDAKPSTARGQVFDEINSWCQSLLRFSIARTEASGGCDGVDTIRRLRCGGSPLEG